MKIKPYIKKINNVINTFIKTSINEEYQAFMGSNFCAHLDDNKIEWTLLYADEDGKAFYDNFVSRFPIANKLGLFTVSVLHEIGHFETEDEIEDDTDLRNLELTNEEYFNLFNERIATEWAGNWIMENTNLATAFDREVYNAIFEMYDKALDKNFKKPLDIIQKTYYN